MSAFGDGYPDPRRPRDSYDPYAHDPYAHDPGGYDGADAQVPSHRRGSRMILAAAIGMLALMVVGAVTFAGSLLMARTSAAEKASVAGAASSGEPSTAAAAPTGASSDPAENATATATATAATSSAPAPARTTPPAKPRTTAAQVTGNAAFEAQVLSIVNTERAKANCRPLAFNAKLTTAARKHSADMAARNYFSHDTPEGVKFGTRISNEGYIFSGAAENIAAGQRTPADVMKAWMDSDGHRANILNCGLKDLGVGLAYRGKMPYWTQDFGTAR